MFKYLSNFYTQYINDSIIGKEKLALALKILIIKRKDHIHNVLYYIVYISYSRGLLGVPDLQGGDVLCPAPAPLPPAELVAEELPVDLALVGGAPRDLDGARAAEKQGRLYTVWCLCRGSARLEWTTLSFHYISIFSE